MLVCDELGDCYDDGTSVLSPTDTPNVGTQPTDSGDPCDPNSVSYDPVACANASGGFGGQGGDVTPGIGFFDPAADLTDGEISWCQANPGACDASGVTALNLTKFCQDMPANCDTLSDGTVGTTTTSGGVRPSGGGFKIPGTAPAATGTGTSILAGINSFLSGLFHTCPAGYVKTANGQCVSASSVGTGGKGLAGFGSGMIGGVSIGTIAIIALVLFLIARKKA
jgi:hypothetical protein